MVDVISQSEAARRAGISRAAIQKHLKIGRIKSVKGQVDLASFNAWLGHKEIDAEAEKQIDPVKGLSDLQLPVFDTLQQAELYKTSYEARLRQLEYDLKSGEVVLITDVVDAVGAQLSNIRTRLLALPAETAPQLFNCRTVVEVQERLHKLIVRILQELSIDETWKETLSQRDSSATEGVTKGELP